MEASIAAAKQNTVTGLVISPNAVFEPMRNAAKKRKNSSKNPSVASYRSQPLWKKFSIESHTLKKASPIAPKAKGASVIARKIPSAKIPIIFLLIFLPSG
ncbi:hypothetical protein HYU14_02660 [Candidatus Woesearchaeota archaeon]|nr:hypothetical protein [Candidatus Woesearchaeota archaeon]